MVKVCTKCQTEQPTTNFYQHTGARTSPGYLNPICKKCHSQRSIKWQKENPEKNKAITRRTQLKKKYGLTVEQYDIMLAKQDGLCCLCNKEHKRRPLNVDHCHTTGKIRGLLCDKCNLAIGLLSDDPTLLTKIKGYLTCAY